MEFVEVPRTSRPGERRETSRTYINLGQITRVEENGPNPLNDGVTVTLSSGEDVEVREDTAEKILGYCGVDLNRR